MTSERDKTLDADAMALLRDYKLKERSVLDLRQGFIEGHNLAVVLRETMERDRLSDMKARIVLIAAFPTSELQVFGLWKRGVFSDDKFDRLLRDSINANNPP